MESLLSTTGLSMSQAQSISNLCYQQVLEIDNIINSINNSSKLIVVEGIEYVETQAYKIPENIIELIIKKGKLTSTQAFLMEAIKEKDDKLNELKSKGFDIIQYELNNPKPVKETILQPIYLKEVDENWGWDKLSLSECTEFLENEAHASQIGKFIHKQGKLNILRTELSKLKSLEWISIKDGEKTPVKVSIHHTSDELLNIHTKLAELHRSYEQKVNYYKSKVKNLVTIENARIAEYNANLQNEYAIKYSETSNKFLLEQSTWNSKFQEAKQLFEKERNEEIKKLVALRIKVDPRFQETIDSLMVNKD